MSKWVTLVFSRCRPEACDGSRRLCAAARACTRRILVQETPGESPVQLSRELCRGCRDCARACPLGAIE